MTTYDLALVTVALTQNGETGSSVPVLTNVTVQQSAPVTPLLAGEHVRWSIHAVDKQGNIFASFPSGNVGAVIDTLNAPKTATFSIPIGDPDLDQLPLLRRGVSPTREVQLFRNGRLMFWGVPTKRHFNFQTGMAEYQATDPSYYLTRRFMGSANRGSILRNGDFSDNYPTLDTFDGWGFENCTPSSDTDNVLTGSESLHLASLSNDGFAFQQKIVTAGPLGLPMYLVAWVWVSPTNFGGGQIGDRGVFLVVRAPYPGGPILKRNGKPNYNSAPLNKSTPPGSWQRLETSVFVPPRTTVMLEARLYAPPGEVSWAAALLVTREEMALIKANHSGRAWDQLDIAKKIVQHAQGNFDSYDLAGNRNHKSDEYVGTKSTPNTSGIPAERIYYFAEHPRVYVGGKGGVGALDEWPIKPHGFDLSCEFNPTQRWMHFWYPRRGSDRSTLAFEFGKNVTYATGGVDEDLSATANQVIIMGSGVSTIDPHGASREEGYAEDLEALGDTTLEWVESAPTGSPIDRLQNIAAGRLRQHENATAQQLTLELYEPRNANGDVSEAYIGVLTPGDVIRVRLRWPIDQPENQQPVPITERTIADGLYRLVQTSLSGVTDRITAQLNPVGGPP